MSHDIEWASPTLDIRGYKVKALAATGAWGSVYLASQNSVQRDVAIKVIRHEYANNPFFIRRFEVEAQLIARLEHPHIVPLHDYWRDSNGAFLVMRWMKGGSALQRIQTNPFTATELALIATQIGSALQTAHAAGIVHGDIKPSNILLDETGNAYLSDFGIAVDQLGDGESTIAPSLGSPIYTSPERQAGQPLRPSSDIYSFAVALTHLLTGRPTSGIPDPQLSDGLNMVLAHALDPDPEQRHRWPSAFADAFKGALADPSPSVIDLTDRAAIPQIDESLTAEPPVPNPYVGLRPFTEADANLYFGREREVNELLARLAENRFVALVGPSGSGKSSLLSAGVMPALRGGKLDGSSAWFIVEMVPGSHPFDQLQQALERVAVNHSLNMAVDLRVEPGGIVSICHRMLPPDGEIVIVIDQFEELFTLVQDETERSRFVDSLVFACQSETSNIHIMIGIRADHFDQPLRYPELGGLIDAQAVSVLPLTGTDLERAITGPAAVAGIDFEAGVPHRIATDVSRQPGALPLMQYALSALFENREGTTLTANSYNVIGGVRHALTQRAEELFNSLTAAAQGAAPQVFTRLVNIADDRDDTRRRVLRHTLAAPDDSAATEVTERFGEANLLTFDRDPITREPTVELAHEALLAQWPRMRRWIDEDRADLTERRNITDRHQAWLSRGQAEGDLLFGLPLHRAIALAARSPALLSTEEHHFVAMGRMFYEASVEADRVAAEAQRRQNTKLRILLATVAALLTAALIAGGLALRSRSEARNQTKLAQAEISRADASALAADALGYLDSNPALGLALAAESYVQTQKPILEARAALLSSRQRFAERTWQPMGPPRTAHTDLVFNVAFSSDGVHLATVGRDMTLLVWDATNVDPVFAHETGHSQPIKSVQFSPDDTRIATAGNDGTIRLFSWPAGEFEVELGTRTDDQGRRINQIDFSSDSSHIAAARHDGTIEVWDLATKSPKFAPVKAHEDMTSSVRYSPDNKMLVSTGGDGTVRLWDSETGIPWQELPITQHEGPGTRAIFDPTGELVASASSEGAIHINRLSEPNSAVEFVSGNGRIDGLAFNPDGTRLATASADGIIRIWDTTTNALIEAIPGNQEQISWVAYSPDGNTLAATSGRVLLLYDLTPGMAASTKIVTHDKARDLVRVPGTDDIITVGVEPLVARWNASTGAAVGEPPAGHTDLVKEVVITQDGKTFVTSGRDETFIIWDTATMRPRFDPIAAGIGFVGALALIDNDTVVLTGGGDGTLAWWDLRSGALIQRKIMAHDGAINSIAVTPDGLTFATVSEDTTVLLWDTASSEPTITPLLGHTRTVRAAAFNADGTTLATGGDDTTIRLWDTERGSAIGEPLDSHTNTVKALAFESDGTLISGGADATIRLWNIERGRQIGRSLTDHQGAVERLITTRDGSFLSASDDGSIRRWSAGNYLVACQLALRYVTEEQIGRALGPNRDVRACSTP